MKRADQSKDSKGTRSNALTVEIYSTHSTFNKDSDPTIHLQRTIGNQATIRLMHSGNGFDFAKIGIHQSRGSANPEMNLSMRLIEQLSK